MYMLNKGTNVLPTTISIDGAKAVANPVPKGEDGVFASAVVDKDKKEIIVKVINTTAQAKPVTINLNGGSKINGTAEVTVLDCSNYDAENMPSKPEMVSPKKTTAEVTKGQLKASVPGKNFYLFKVKM